MTPKAKKRASASILSPAQQQLAAEFSWLPQQLANKYTRTSWDADRLQGVLVDALVHAASKWDPVKEKGTGYSYVRRALQWKIQYYWRYRSKDPEVVGEVPPTENETQGVLLFDGLEHHLQKTGIQVLTTAEMALLKDRLAGYSHRQLAIKWSCSRVTVCARCARIREKLQNAFGS